MFLSFSESLRQLLNWKRRMCFNFGFHRGVLDPKIQRAYSKKNLKGQHISNVQVEGGQNLPCHLFIWLTSHNTIDKSFLVSARSLLQSVLWMWPLFVNTKAFIYCDVSQIIWNMSILSSLTWKCEMCWPFMLFMDMFKCQVFEKNWNKFSQKYKAHPVCTSKLAPKSKTVKSEGVINHDDSLHDVFQLIML